MLGVIPAGETTLKAGESETFSCEHMLAEAGRKPVQEHGVDRVAARIEKPSNTVEVEIKKPNFEVIKEQRIKGEATYTTAKLKAEVGRDRGIQDHGEEHGEHDPEIRSAERHEMHELLAGARRRSNWRLVRTKVYTCEHVLVEGDGPIYKNVATAKGGEKEKETPPVEVEVEEPTNSKSRRNSGSRVKLVVHDGEIEF